jgi:hypothetical protein
VVVAAMADRRVHKPLEIDTGTLRGDLRAAVDDLIGLARSEGTVIMGVGGSMAQHPELAHAIQVQIVDVEQERFKRIVERARVRKETAANVAELAFEVAPAMVFGRVVQTGGPLDTAFVDALVDDVLLPLFTMRARMSKPKK